MNYSIDITSSSKIKVLVVPILPIKKSTFKTQLSLLRKYSLFEYKEQLNVLTSKKEEEQEKQLFFEFITNNDHSYLDEFQAHRHIFGVIGLLDYQDYQNNKKLCYEGYQKFQELILEKFSEATITRCFVFNDIQSTKFDIIPRLTFIKDINNIDQIMQLFSKDILYQISVKLQYIKNVPVIESPPSFPAGFSITDHTRLQNKNNNHISQPNSIITATTTSTSLFHQRHSSFNSTITTYSSFPSPPSPTPSLSNTSVSSVTVDSNEKDLTKQRSPGRLLKLMADLYLLSGDLNTSKEHYKKAIEMSKPLYDYLWIASAKEGLACINLLNAYYYYSEEPKNLEKDDLDLQNDIDTQQVVKEEGEPISQPSTLTSSTIETMVDSYEHIMYYYLLVDTSSSTTTPSIIYAEACLKIARFLATVFIFGGLNKAVLSKFVQYQADDDPLLARQCITRDVLKNGKNSSGIKRFSIAKWISKIWLIELNNMSLVDQIHLMTHMSFVLSNIGYYRKAAWFISETLDRMLPLIMQNSFSLNPHHHRSTLNGVLSLLNFMCKLYGIQEKKHKAYEVNNGWTKIQIDILKQCIIISEALQDDRHIVYYSTLILKNMSQCLSKKEQIYFATLVHRTSSMGQLTGQISDTIEYTGPTILMCLEYISSSRQKFVYKNICKNKVDLKEPFYYNPFLKKIKKNENESDVYVIKNQECEFKAILGNPFSYDIEISSITPRASGVKFSPILSSSFITIPANEVISVNLTGIPLETGLLEVRGCHVKLKGFVETEFFPKAHSCTVLDSLLDYQDMIKYSDFYTIKYLSEQECRLGQLINVIEEQPLLNIRSTSIIDKSVTLFEGEEVVFNLRLENISDIPVNYIKLSFTESHHLYTENLSDEDRYEMELKTPLLSWIDDEDVTQSGKRVHLLPGQCIETNVSVYGKFGCTHGDIYIDYGYSSPDTTTQPEYIRQLHLPITISTYQHIEPSNWNFSRLYPSDHSLKKNEKEEEMSLISKKTLEEQLEAARYLTDEVGSSAYFLISFDLYNSWSIAFDIEFDIDNSDNEVPEKEKNIMKSNLLLLPGQTKRIVLPMKKLYLSPEKAVKPIPNKQIIVLQENTKKGRAQLFWYRQLLLKRFKAKWSHFDRKGQLELGSLRLNLNQSTILKEHDLKFMVSFNQGGKTIGYRKFQCSIYHSVTMHISIFNRHDYPVKLILRIQPTQRYDDNVRDHDLADKLIFEGLTQLVLPEIPANESIVHSLPLVFISCGQYEFIHHVENVHTREIHYDNDWVHIHALSL